MGKTPGIQTDFLEKIRGIHEHHSKSLIPVEAHTFLSELVLNYEQAWSNLLRITPTLLLTMQTREQTLEKVPTFHNLYQQEWFPSVSDWFQAFNALNNALIRETFKYLRETYSLDPEFTVQAQAISLISTENCHQRNGILNLLVLERTANDHKISLKLLEKQVVKAMNGRTFHLLQRDYLAQQLKVDYNYDVSKLSTTRLKISRHNATTSREYAGYRFRNYGECTRLFQALTYVKTQTFDVAPELQKYVEPPYRNYHEIQRVPGRFGYIVLCWGES